MKNISHLMILGLVASSTSLASAQGFRTHKEALGPLFEAAPEQTTSRKSFRQSALDSIRRWNQIAVDASGLDHTPLAPDGERIFGEHLGPGRSSRAIAIVQIAVFEAVNAIHPRYESYVGIRPASDRASMDAAVAQAAHDTLVELYPSQAEQFDLMLSNDLDEIDDEKAKENGIEVGQRAALEILELREDDGSEHDEPRVGSGYVIRRRPGRWRQDPISQSPLALGAYWEYVTPFVMEEADQFRVPPPPGLDSEEYAEAYRELKRLGGDGVNTPTRRTEEQTQIGIFWAYDGTPSLCAPPRLYNQIALVIADRMESDDEELARLLALVNVAMADTGIAAWESKYHYDFWRPITGIRESTSSGNDSETPRDRNFTPLGAPASNLVGPNFTPPFPSYPSGHAAFGGALFQTLRNVYGTDDIAFSFVSDEFNGETRDHEGNVRPWITRQFSSLSEAEEENGQSRIYLGIHWSFDKTEGIEQGRRVADHIFSNAFQPLVEER